MSFSAAFWQSVLSLFLTFLVGVLGLVQTGCSAAYWTGRLEPGTVLSFNPATHEVFVRDTKDNNFAIEECAYNKETGEFRLKGVQVTNMSSPVIAADDARMERVERIMRIQLEMHQSAHEVIKFGLARGGEVGQAMIAGGVAALHAIPEVSGTLNTQWGSGGFTLTPTGSTCPAATSQPCVTGQ